MKVTRKSTPKMVVRPHFRYEYEKFNAQYRRHERFKFTVALLVLWAIAVGVWSIVR